MIIQYNNDIYQCTGYVTGNTDIPIFNTIGNGRAEGIWFMVMGILIIIILIGMSGLLSTNTK